MRFLFSILIVSLPLWMSITAKGHPEIIFSLKHQSALRSIINIEDSALLKIEFLEKELTNDPTVTYLRHYHLFITFLRYERESDYLQFKRFDDKLINDWNNKELDPNLKTLQANVYFHKGVVEAIHTNNWSAFSSFADGYRLIRNNESLTSNNDIQKFQSIFLILFDQLPESVNWLTQFVGLKGNTNAGFKQLAQYLESVSNIEGIYDEGLIYTALMHLKFNNTHSVFLNKNSDLFQNQESPVLNYIYGWLTLKNQVKIKKFSNSLTEKFPLLYYINGRHYLNALNDSCINQFNSFIEKFEGNSYKADALLRCCIFYKIKNDTVQLKKTILQLNNLNGYSTSLDQRAKKEANIISSANQFLLKSRLLYDGGEYDKAINILTSHKEEIQMNNAFHEEYFYRLAQLYKKQGLYTKAIENYKLSMTVKNPKYYYAPTAAYEIAHYHYKQGNYEKSKYYIKQCDKLNTNDFKADIKQKNDALKLKLEL
ncbi:MAG: hypothetical protein JW717_12485 [Marinilabiliaceae bacterium]|nr:hypothetical protein [Marinilabiliaceae bacterium]